MNATELSAYAQAADSGRYDRVTGLQGKYDHVRVHWEDQTLRLRLGPHLQRLVDRRLAAGRDLRLLDLGCGSGDGYETLLGMQRHPLPAAASSTELLPPQRLERYTGIELNPALLEQARLRHRDSERTRFIQADLREGLPFDVGEPPYDVYFASFGTLSHLGEEETVALLGEIARHADDGSLLLIDWLGRYAYEWSDLWDADLAREQWMDYRISYIYPPHERRSRKIDAFPLRLLCEVEARRVLARVETGSGIRLVERDLFDRSLFVGRHMDTAEYNPHARPLREAVNRLHEPLCRTDLQSLCFELHVPEGFAEVADALRAAHGAWNAVVRYAAEGLARADAGTAPPEVPAGMPAPVRATVERLAQAIGALGACEMDDPRAAWLEPQLGLALRNLELELQRGLGCGHGLVAICEIRRP
ncbi:MAG: class I SAM-dependent methyltransferase [Candidatus Eiseniibacteriota bacterium]|jgi:SAM-dependent methyltransferase